MHAVMQYLGVESGRDALWLGIGLFAQAMFTMRFLVQWIVSERAGASVMPLAFWWFSMAGGLLLLAYGIYRGEPIIILGQATGVIIYVRNLQLIYRKRPAEPT